MFVKSTNGEGAFEGLKIDDTIECGKEAAKHFGFGKGYRNLNHGSFGTYPTVLRPRLQHFQDQAEARPDTFIRYDYPKLLDESREAIAKYLNCPTPSCVFVLNATTGINTVLRGMVFDKGDVIIYFATIYGACEKTIEYITEMTPAESYKIEFTYPVSDDYLCAAFEDAVRSIERSGREARLAIFDTVVALGVRAPFERLTKLCKANDVLSCIDGAHGVGHIPLDMSELDPDFFVSNCHKWLYVPRSCAIFYVPERNQHLIRSTIPTSHGFVPLPKEGEMPIINNPLPPSGKSAYINNFEFVGTMDNSPYLCVPAALQWRSKITWNGKKGEEAIVAYNQQLARRAAECMSAILNTEVMENEERTLGECNFANVRLPLPYAEVTGGKYREAIKVAQWISQVLVDEYDTFIVVMCYGEAWWVRMSSQVYLTIEDFEWGANILKQVCDRARAGEWKR